MYIGYLFTTYFGPKGPSSVNTYIQNYSDETLGCGWFVYKWGHICAVGRFIL